MNKPRKFVLFGVAAVLAIFTLSASSCSTDTPSDNAQQTAQDNAQNRQNYIPTNDIEGKNYNARQKLADNPNTILWCSIYPTNPNVKPYTVPIVGKLTSSSKRPYPTTQAYSGNSGGYFSPELPGSDAMYGASAEYRYGFDPAGNYWDFYGSIEGVCSSVPTVIQKNTTDFAITATGDVNELSSKANAALRECNNNDPSKPCATAAEILGITAEGK